MTGDRKREVIKSINKNLPEGRGEIPGMIGMELFGRKYVVFAF